MMEMSRIFAGLLISSIWPALLVAAGTLALTKLWPGLSALTRYRLWFLALIFITVLPFTRGVLVSEAVPQQVEVLLPVAEKGAFESVPSPVAETRDNPATVAASIGLTERMVQTLRVREIGEFSAKVIVWVPPHLAPRILNGVIFGWVLIALFFTLRLAGNLAALSRIKRESKPLPSAILRVGESLIRIQSSGRSVEIRSSSEIPVPCIAGLVNPVILLPDGLINRMDGEDIERILIHELTHISRRDDWLCLMESVLKSLLFFQPALLFIIKQLRLEREIACDEEVVSTTEQPQEYAKCLASVAEMSQLRTFPVAALAAAFPQKHIVRRITMIISKRVKPSTILTKLACVAIIGLFGLVFVQCAYTPESYAAVPADSAVKAPEAAPKPVPPKPEKPTPRPAPAPHPKPAPAPTSPPTVPDFDIELPDLDEIVDVEEIQKIVQTALVAAEKGLVKAEVQLRKMEAKLKAHEAEMERAGERLGQRLEVLTEKEMEELEARVEVLASVLEAKVEARVEALDREKLGEEEYKRQLKISISKIQPDIDRMTKEITALAKQLENNVMISIGPEIEKAMQEIMEAQKEIQKELKELK